MQLWIGLVGVGALPGSETLGESAGAYVNVIVRCAGEAQFQASVREALKAMGMFPFEFEDVEPLAARQEGYLLDDEIATVAARVEATGEVGFATFHSFRRPDA